LLLLRVAAGVSAITNAFISLRAGPSGPQLALDILSIAAGLLIMAGLWTPVSGVVVAALEAWVLVSRQPIDFWATILLGAIGAGLALLGPGAWSIDARLFGWKRIDMRDRVG
jgi:uncharacterized membrane protein YphA (DoxX/SURF4 family)